MKLASLDSVAARTVRTLIENGLGEARIDIVDQICADSYLDHDLMNLPVAELPRTKSGGKKELRSLVRWLGQENVDLKFMVKQLIVEDSSVGVHIVARGQVSGLLTSPSAGWLEIETIGIFLVDEKVREHWGRYAIRMKE